MYLPDGTSCIVQGYKKVSSTLQLPYPSILRGLGVTFCVFFPHNSLMNILQKILTDHFEEMLYIQHPRDSVIENVEKMIHCGAPLLAAPCMPALPAEISNLSPSAVIPASVLPAATCMPLTGLPLCLLRSSMSSIAIAFSLSPGNSVLCSYLTVLF